jgi:hypothetical protein
VDCSHGFIVIGFKRKSKMVVGDPLGFDNKIWHTGCDAFVSVKVTENFGIAC